MSFISSSPSSSSADTYAESLCLSGFEAFFRIFASLKKTKNVKYQNDDCLNSYSLVQSHSKLPQDSLTFGYKRNILQLHIG